MKKLILFLIAVLSIKTTDASNNSITIINQSSDEITVSVQTQAQTVQVSALINENQTVNTMNNSVLTSTQLSFKVSPIIKIVVHRLSTNLPQIIYYNHEITVDDRQQPIGIYNINLGRPGTMTVLQDSVTINNQLYNLTDLKSCMTRCMQLHNQITATNLDLIQEQINDVQDSVKSMQNSDKNKEIESQLIAIQSQIDLVNNALKIMKVCNQNLKILQDLITNLSSQNAQETQKTLINLQISMRTLTQSSLQGAVYAQAQAVQNSITKLKHALQQFGISENSLNFEFLIPYSQDYSINYQQIGSTL